MKSQSTTKHRRPAARSSLTVTADRLAIAEAERAAAESNRQDAEHQVTELLRQIDAGEASGGLGQAREHVEIAQRIEAAKMKALRDATEAHGAALADVTAQEVAESLSSEGSPDFVTQAQTAATAHLIKALAVVPDAVNTRDRICDEAGERLHAAGVPVNEVTGRIAFRPVGAGVGNRTIPGQWNVTVDGTAYSRRRDHGYSKAEKLRLTEMALVTALREHGLRLNGSLSWLN